MICISIQEQSYVTCIKLLKKVEFAELRLDLMKLEKEEIKQLLANIDCKTIVTFRAGEYSDDERMDYLKFAISHGANYVDIEFENTDSYKLELLKFAKEHSCKAIISYHNFNETPGKNELHEITDSCFEQGADIVKLACIANSNDDTARILSLYEKYTNLVAFCMGQEGRISRLASIYLGAPFTFAAIDEESITALGQLSIEKMSQIISLLNNG